MHKSMNLLKIISLTKDEFYGIQIMPHKAVRKRIRDYHEQLYVCESDNSDEEDKFLERHK